MRFTNEIQLSLPADEIFTTLTDIERVAGCLPGARLEGRDGDAYLGAMRLKVGPVTADYHGTLTFEELDTEGRRAVLLARGEETAGQGHAEARIVSSVHGDGGGARVVVETELQVRGRVAQFGSGPMEKIAKRLFADFARNLEELMTNGGSPAGQPDATGERVPSPGSESGGPAPSSRDPIDDSSLNLLSLVAEPLVRSASVSFVPVVAALGVGYWLGRRRARSTA
jgi:uncharacterized protein